MIGKRHLNKMSFALGVLLRLLLVGFKIDKMRYRDNYLVKNVALE